MEGILLYLPFLLPVLVANASERWRRARLAPVPGAPAPALGAPAPALGAPAPTSGEALLDLGRRYLPYALLLAVNLGLLGLAALALFNDLIPRLSPDLQVSGTLTINWLGVAAACGLTALLAFLPLFPGLRRRLARWLPIDPDSYVHTTALVFAIYQIGLSLGQLALIGSLETLTEAGLTLTIWDVLLSGLPWVLFALAGVGLFIRRGWRQAVDRLGLHRPTWRHLLVALAATLLLLALDYAVNLGWQALDSTSYDLLERVTENLFGGLATVGGALVLGLSAGISEELLFRGAVQPRLGLILASLLFAVGHMQYGLSIATLEVLVIGLVLGLLRNRTSTTVAILVHAGYNTVGTLLGMY
jgi:membrane protease YdiL (CAAX protease family)